MDIEIFGVSAVLVILGLVQLAKALGFPSRYAGLMAVLLGVLGSIGFTYQGEALWLEALVVGLAIGLSAAGLYSGSKAALGR